jgi:hypothetical protein
MPEDTTSDDTAELSEPDTPERPEPRRFQFTVSKTVEREYHPNQIRDLTQQKQTTAENALQDLEMNNQMQATDPAELLVALQIDVEEVNA